MQSAELTLKPGDEGVSLLPNWTPAEPPIVSNPSSCFAGLCAVIPAPVVTISFDDEVLDPVNPNTDTTETAFYTVRWASDQFGTQLAELDVQRGAMISIPANSISITASYPVIEGRTHPVMKVRCSLGFGGSRGGLGITNSARRTVRIPEIPNPNAPLVGGTSSNIQPIPRMAVSAVMRNSDVGVPQLTFAQLKAVDPNNVSCRSLIGKLDSESVPVANGSRFFRVSNQTLDPSFDTAVIFYLAL
jgi:hypothetical protein